jgi:hypothetical protein
MHPIKSALALAATVLGMACASAPVPTEQLASTEASVRAAHELGAERVPRAQLHLKLAQEQMQQARKLAEDGETERAGVVLARARADAELALMLSREAAAHRDLESTPQASSLGSGSSATPVTVTTTTDSPEISVVR